MTAPLTHPFTGQRITLEQGDLLCRILWPGTPVLVVVRSAPDGRLWFRLAHPKCSTWNPVDALPLEPWDGVVGEGKDGDAS